MSRAKRLLALATVGLLVGLVLLWHEVGEAPSVAVRTTPTFIGTSPYDSIPAPRKPRIRRNLPPPRPETASIPLVTP